MKKNVVALFMVLFLLPAVSTAAKVKIQNLTNSGGGVLVPNPPAFVEFEGAAIVNHTGMDNTNFSDTWQVTLDQFADNTFSVANTLGPINAFNFEYRLTQNVGWTTWDVSQFNGQQLSINLSNLAGFFLRVSGTVSGLQGGYQMRVEAIPVPAAVWLFGSALVGLAGFSRKKTSSLNA
jgi:hypothetical protein